MSLNIIQWNTNGLVKKLSNIQILNHEYNPILLCLQKPTSEIHIFLQ